MCIKCQLWVLVALRPLRPLGPGAVGVLMFARQGLYIIHIYIYIYICIYIYIYIYMLYTYVYVYTYVCVLCFVVFFVVLFCTQAQSASFWFLHAKVYLVTCVYCVVMLLCWLFVIQCRRLQHIIVYHSTACIIFTTNCWFSCVALFLVGPRPGPQEQQSQQ